MYIEAERSLFSHDPHPVYAPRMNGYGERGSPTSPPLFSDLVGYPQSPPLLTEPESFSFLRRVSPPALLRHPLGLSSEALPELWDVEDPAYFSSLSYNPELQVVVLTSRLGTGVPVVEKIRWIDQELSHLQCPYPIKRIEFTSAGDAVVQFVSEQAKEKALSRFEVLKWRNAEIPFRSCTEEDNRALCWVGAAGCPPELIPTLRQALSAFGDVKGECPPPQNGNLILARNEQNRPPLVKFYFTQKPNVRLLPFLPLHSRTKGIPPVLVRVFTPHGALAPKCADFGKSHSPHGCPECYQQSQQHNAGA